MKNFKRVFTCVLCLAVLCAFSLTALAEQNSSVTILFEHENQPITGAVFRLYKVAETDGNGVYRLNDTFAKYPVSVDALIGDDKAVAASTLAAYISRDGKISADVQAETNSYGAAVAEGLSEGIYLLTGKPVDMENARYIPLPSLVFVPSTDADGNPLHDLTLMPKYEKRELTDGTLDRSVQKLWNDNGYKSHRPNEVTVWLLRNGEFYAEQVLNEAGNWQYTWSGLDAADFWSLVEVDVPDGYAVTVEQQDAAFIVTNTFDDPNTPPDNSGDSNDLPQTGDNSRLDMWIALLAASSTGLLGFAFFCLRKKKPTENISK